jgi:hypothetical protein
MTCQHSLWWLAWLHTQGTSLRANATAQALDQLSNPRPVPLPKLAATRDRIASHQMVRPFSLKLVKAYVCKNEALPEKQPATLNALTCLTHHN